MDAPSSVLRYFEYINADQFERLREIFAPDIELAMAGAGPRSGVDAAVDYYPRALAALPSHLDEPVDIVTNPPQTRSAVEISFTGDTIDGRPVTFTAVDLFDLGPDGRITRLRSFYDTALVARMLRPGTSS